MATPPPRNHKDMNTRVTTPPPQLSHGHTPTHRFVIHPVHRRQGERVGQGTPDAGEAVMYPLRGGPFTTTVRDALDCRVVVDTSNRRPWGAAPATAVRTNR